GDRARPRRQQQDRSELRGRERTDREAAVREVQHEQGEGDDSEPVARVRHELAEEEQTEVAIAQRQERRVRGASQSGGHAENWSATSAASRMVGSTTPLVAMPASSPGSGRSASTISAPELPSARRSGLAASAANFLLRDGTDRRSSSVKSFWKSISNNAA